MRAAGAVVLSAWIAGCGGAVVDDPGDAAPVDPEPGRPGKGLPESPLPPCRDAFDPVLDPSRSCDWVANGACYESRDDACGCECRRTRGAQCVSGFPGPPGARVVVDCI